MASDDSTKKADAQEEERLQRQLARHQRWERWFLVAISILMAYGWLRGNWTAFHALASVMFLATWTWSVSWQLKAVRRQRDALDDRSKALNEQAALLRERLTTLDLRDADLQQREATVGRFEVSRRIDTSIRAMEGVRNAMLGQVVHLLDDVPEAEKLEPPSVYDRLMEDDD